MELIYNVQTLICSYLNIYNLHNQKNRQNAQNLKWFIISVLINNSQFTESLKWIQIGTQFLLCRHNRKKQDIWSELPSRTLCGCSLVNWADRDQRGHGMWDCRWHVTTGQTSRHTCSRPVIRCLHSFLWLMGLRNTS